MAEKALRVKNAPPYLFAELDKKKRQVLASGADLINLGVGDPDKPTPKQVIDKLIEVVQTGDADVFRYSEYEGSFEFRKATTDFYKRRFNVDLDPHKESLLLIGSKEGIAHMFLAYIDPGDYALIPDPAFPVYYTNTLFAGGIPYKMPLLKENNFLPDLDRIPPEIAKKAKLMFLNYPNNPTGATADLKFFEEVVAFAKKYDILICHDNAYSEMSYDGYKAPSFLEAAGAKDVGIEFGSLSKPCNMTGWRLGYAVGNADAISALGYIKSNIDSSQFNALQYAGVEAFKAMETFTPAMNAVYQRRRDALIDGLNSLGWNVEKIKATFYVWVKIPEKYTSMEFVMMLLEKAQVMTIPGNTFGEYGEGYIRFALTVDEDRIKEAIERIRKVNIKF